MKTSILDEIYTRSGDEYPWRSKESIVEGTVRFFDGGLHRSIESSRRPTKKKHWFSSTYEYEYETFWVRI